MKNIDNTVLFRIIKLHGTKIRVTEKRRAVIAAILSLLSVTKCGSSIPANIKIRKQEREKKKRENNGASEKHEKTLRYRTIELTGADFRHVTDEPVGPIEKSSSRCARMRSHSRHEGLNEAENCSGQTNRSVYSRGTPCSDFHEYYDEGRDRHRPSEHHEEPMPLKGEGGKIDKISLQRKEGAKGYQWGVAFLFLRFER